MTQKLHVDLHKKKHENKATSNTSLLLILLGLLLATNISYNANTLKR